MRILVILRHPQEQMLGALGQAGFETVAVSDSVEGIRSVYQLHPDAVIMGDDLSPVGGQKLHSRLHEICFAPIIVVGQKGEYERAMMVEEGADIYLDTSVSYVELIARIYSLVHRYPRRKGSLSFDPKNSRVELGQSATNLTPTEFRLLSCLVFNREKVLSYARLITEVWGRGVTLEAAHFYVRRLKQKVGIDSTGPYRLLNHRGEGYCFHAN